jgi:ferric-dicitrate binding protein FerR (iron transport regulator)
MVVNTTAHVKKIVLADSSVVWLNAHASLSWKDEAYERRVTLNGEGYFEVRINAQQPFIVDTRDMQIRVLGTAFNVEAYQAEKMTRVALVNGSVQLRAQADSNRQTLLQPGQTATLANADTFAITAANAAAISSWTNGGFVVNNISVKDAVARLCERNACTLQWKNTKDIYKTVSVSFMGESFEQSLGNLCYLIHKQYKLKGNRAIIY